MFKTTKRTLVISAALAAAWMAAPASAADKIIIGFSQASSNSAHRNTMTKRNQQYATGVLMGWLAVVGSSALEADRERLKKKVLLHG